MFQGSKSKILLLCLAVCFMVISPHVVFGQDATDAVKPYISAIEEAKEGLTLWQMVKSGGFIMIVLFAVSIFTGYLIIYNFLTLNEEKFIPKKFSDEVLESLEGDEKKKLVFLCDKHPSIMATILKTGLSKNKRGIVFVKESIENSVRKELGKLWQNISYLADVANIAPLIGLLGTVLGMMQAFNVIAFQSAVVKPVLLAGGVSKAMVTTAGGLFVAIPAFLLYSYFRARVQAITSTVETFTEDVVKLLEEH